MVVLDFKMEMFLDLFLKKKKTALVRNVLVPKTNSKFYYIDFCTKLFKSTRFSERKFPDFF